MSLLRDAVFKRLPSLHELIKTELNAVNLKALKKLTVRFDPFTDGVKDIRKFSHCITQADVVRTNPKCVIKTEILTDRTEPHIVFEAVNDQKFIFKCGNLKCLEIFQLMNKHITPLAPQEDVVIPEPLKKMMKKK